MPAVKKTNRSALFEEVQQIGVGRITGRLSADAKPPAETHLSVTNIQEKK